MRRCWYGAFRFFDVRVLVPPEGRHFQIVATTILVPDDKSVEFELAQKQVNVAVVVGQNFGLEPNRPKLKATFSIGVAPEPSEQDARQRIAFGERVVHKKAWLDGACPRHLVPSNFAPAHATEIAESPIAIDARTRQLHCPDHFGRRETLQKHSN